MGFIVASINWHCVKNVQMWSLFWSVFSHILPEYGELIRKSPYSVWMGEIQTRRNSVIWHFSRRLNLQYFIHNCQCLHHRAYPSEVGIFIPHITHGTYPLHVLSLCKDLNWFSLPIYQSQSYRKVNFIAPWKQDVN